MGARSADLRSVGQVPGAVILGTVLVNISTSHFPGYLPPEAQRLPAALLTQAADPQVLADAQKQRQIVQVVTRVLVEQNRAGSGQGQDLTHLTAQATALCAQIFGAARHALADGLHLGFLILLGMSLVVVLLTLLLKDVPLRGRAERPAGPTAR
ncbi:hypothetical protein [Thermogemmatispora carboxidivorans]|uniref:hypothetical protein n=1 Tax=Thermogemmatispora carboxidivorans TaxID=1382306 RepID=UPI00069BC09B|nr:hypothetical protein [Thermogemmatispora carboxidivorans]